MEYREKIAHSDDVNIEVELLNEKVERDAKQFEELVRGLLEIRSRLKEEGMLGQDEEMVKVMKTFESHKEGLKLYREGGLKFSKWLQFFRDVKSN